MSVVVVARSVPKAGRMQDVLDAFAVVTPKVHAEQGCELYAVHHDDTYLVVVERWTSQADLDAHAAGEPIAELGRLAGDAFDAPGEVLVLLADSFGDPTKGVLQ